VQLQIEELSRRLRANDLGIPANPDERSPSPEPIYNNEGKRLNTREYRTRRKLEEERHRAITRMNEINKEYKPPTDYKPPVVKVSDKVMIPQETYPDINFVGLLIGPRGNTLKSMEKDTGAKIIIRGKGSVKEGKVGRKDGPMPGEDEPLHAFVTGNNLDSVNKAVQRIKEVIRQGVEVPEGQNDLRRMQLRELALLNGTLRETDGPRCTNCGHNTHKSWQCPEKPNLTAGVICTLCGNAGHIAKDCRQKLPGQNQHSSMPMNNAPSSGGGGGSHVDRQKIDQEYMSLMAELGEGPPPPTNSNNNSGGGGGGSGNIQNLFGSRAPRPLLGLGPPPNLMRPSNPQQHQQQPPPVNPWSNGPPTSNGNSNMPPFSMANNGPRPMLGGPNGGFQQQGPNAGPPSHQRQQMMPGLQQHNMPDGGNMGQPQQQQQMQQQPPSMLSPAPNPWQQQLGQLQHQMQQQQQQQQQNNQQQQPPQQQQQQPSPLLQGPPPPQGQGGGWGGPPSNLPPWQQQQAPPPPPGMGGPPAGMGCPPPGPVPPPRPVCPPPGWRFGPPGPPQHMGGPPQRPGGPGGVDLGALLSAPPPPPPS